MIIYTLFAAWVLVFPLTFIPGYDGKDEQEEFYGFSLWQMLTMFFGAFVIAGLLAPITFGIFLFTYYRFRKLIDAVFES